LGQPRPRALPRKGRARIETRAALERGWPEPRLNPGGRDAAYLRKQGLSRAPQTPTPRPHPAGRPGFERGRDSGGGRLWRGGWLKRGWDPSIPPPSGIPVPHARYRAPLIRFAGRILTYRRASRREPSLEQLLPGSSGMCGGVQRTIVFSRRTVPTTCGVSF